MREALFTRRLADLQKQLREEKKKYTGLSDGFNRLIQENGLLQTQYNKLQEEFNLLLKKRIEEFLENHERVDKKKRMV
jgi:predicted nuclease with TOPRIM domain